MRGRVSVPIRPHQQANQLITLLSDGGEIVRDLQLYLNPPAEHILDWFHVGMRLTVLQQIAKGLPQTSAAPGSLGCIAP
jgi:hypothetical protein